MNEPLIFYAVAFTILQASLFFHYSKYNREKISERILSTVMFTLILPPFVSGVLAAIVFIPAGLFMTLKAANSYVTPDKYDAVENLSNPGIIEHLIIFSLFSLVTFISAFIFRKISMQKVEEIN